MPNETIQPSPALSDEQREAQHPEAARLAHLFVSRLIGFKNDEWAAEDVTSVMRQCVKWAKDHAREELDADLSSWRERAEKAEADAKRLSDGLVTVLHMMDREKREAAQLGGASCWHEAINEARRETYDKCAKSLRLAIHRAALPATPTEPAAPVAAGELPEGWEWKKDSDYNSWALWENDRELWASCMFNNGASSSIGPYWEWSLFVASTIAAKAPTGRVKLSDMTCDEALAAAKSAATAAVAALALDQKGGGEC